MLHNTSSRPIDHRPAVVLLIVISMLALFAVVALGFVYYAESEATASRYYRQAATLAQADIEPELLLSYFLGQLIYDVDDTNGIYSAMRGHSLARSMYGYNSSAQNTVPFNGTGRLHYTVTPTSPAFGGTSQDNYLLINYTWFEKDASGALTNFKRKPEHYDVTGSDATEYKGGANVPYTYPDLNNMFLAAVRGSDGAVLIPSFHRSWTGVNFSNTTDPWQKYLTLRPHKSYHTNFPDPEDGFADVKNLETSPGTLKSDGTYALNDSFWMDLGFPVMTAPNGLKYKPLFAALVLDLDNRVNLSIAGNYLNAHVSSAANQGFGRWEINPAKVFADANEYPNLFYGNNGLPGRYGVKTTDMMGNPIYPTPATAVTAYTGAQYPSFWAAFDFDGRSKQPLSLPTAGTLNLFPSYQFNGTPMAGDPGWDYRQAVETSEHPAGYNYWRPSGSNSKPVHPAHMEALLRWGGKNAPAIASGWYKLLPNNMNNAKFRNLVTSLSMDVDRMGGLPYITYDPRVTYGYKLETGDLFPTIGNGLFFPTAAQQPDANSPEFRSDWRGKLPTAGRLNLNRKLTDYPLADAATGQINLTPLIMGMPNPNVQQVKDALNDRQKFAQDIYKFLILVTGASDPNTSPGLQGNDVKAYNAAKYLAQLAVNIVDYVDNDDHVTAFRWEGSNFVYGVELPRLVINEVYSSWDNDPGDNQIANNMRAGKYFMNIWVELHNPLSPPLTGATYPLDQSRATLRVGDHKPYELWVCDSDPATLAKIAEDGELPAGNAKLGVVNKWGGNANTTQYVEPCDRSPKDATKTNKGFYVVGPELDPNMPFLPGRDPGLTATYSDPELSIKYNNANTAIVKPTILLRRLACTHLPEQSNPNQDNYNPYITVDYMTEVDTQDNRLYDKDGVVGAPKALNELYSEGRKQPYAGIRTADANSKVVRQNPATVTTIKHTFYRQNTKDDTGVPPATGDPTLDTPFQWLTHLDRKLINAMELVHVAACPPHQLTQRFYDKNGNVFAHRAPWFNETALLYRFLAMATVPDLMEGQSPGGRVPGLININNVWDEEVFAALYAAGAGNKYTDANAQIAFRNLMKSRSPGDIPSSNDKPFLPLGVGYTPQSAMDPQYPNGLSIDNTILRRDPANNNQPYLSMSTESHPYLKAELMTRIFGNVTTKSNCFAVWLTVGFFEVEDENARPPKLGKEIGKADGRNIRHRMFAIIDRTQLRLSKDPVETSPTSTTIPAGDQTVSVKSVQITPPNSNIPITIPKGAWATVEARNASNVLLSTEDIVILDVDTAAKTLRANFTQTHTGNITFIVRGNPGPWPNYNVRRDTDVVPHYTVID